MTSDNFTLWAQSLLTALLVTIGLSDLQGSALSIFVITTISQVIVRRSLWSTLS